MGQAYRNVVPPKTLLEPSDEDICGTFDTNPVAAGNYLIGETPFWGSDILVRRFGSGRLVFTHLRILENLGEDPAADHIFVNMLSHFARRSVPSEEAVQPLSAVSQWLRSERETVRRWQVIGMFPNWNGAGHDTAYPPEDSIDPAATYPGWYKPISWCNWYSLHADKHVMDLQAALSPVYQYYPRFDYGTAYAYAEFTSERRQPVMLDVAVQNATKLWLNGRLVFENSASLPHQTLEEHEVESHIKQGRNTVLLKVSKVPGEYKAGFDIRSGSREPLRIAWWK